MKKNEKIRLGNIGIYIICISSWLSLQTKINDCVRSVLIPHTHTHTHTQL